MSRDASSSSMVMKPEAGGIRMFSNSNRPQGDSQPPACPQGERSEANGDYGKSAARPLSS